MIHTEKKSSGILSSRHDELENIARKLTDAELVSFSVIMEWELLNRFKKAMGMD